jgi:hypothetical protein
LSGSTCFRFRCQDPLDLLPMVYIVPGHHADHMLNRFLSALGMDAVVFPLLGCQRLEHGCGVRSCDPWEPRPTSIAISSTALKGAPKCM